MKRKTVIMLLAVAAILGLTIGGTLAWLTDTTDSVKNTFTTSDVDIELKETTGTEYQMVPGYTITKDPKVTVKADSEKCYLFVKLDKSENFDSFMTYAMADDWTALTEVSNVFYRIVEDTNADQEFVVIKDNAVSVKNTVTKADMNGLTEATYPTLTVTAYACQYMKDNDTAFTAADAWANVSA